MDSPLTCLLRREERVSWLDWLRSVGVPVPTAIIQAPGTAKPVHPKTTTANQTPLWRIRIPSASGLDLIWLEFCLEFCLGQDLAPSPMKPENFRMCPGAADGRPTGRDCVPCYSHARAMVEAFLRLVWCRGTFLCASGCIARVSHHVQCCVCILVCRPLLSPCSSSLAL